MFSLSTVYETISQLCKERGITLHRLSKEADVGFDTLTALKKGERTDLSPMAASRVADYFGRPITDFIEQKGNTPISTIGINIRHRRIAMQMTLEELSQEVDISISVLSKIETGRNTSFNPILIVKIARALGTTPHALLEWNEEKDERIAVNRIIRQLGALSDDNIAILDILVTAMKKQK